MVAACLKGLDFQVKAPDEVIESANISGEKRAREKSAFS